MSPREYSALIAAIGGFLMFAVWDDHDWLHWYKYEGFFGTYRERDDDPTSRNVMRVIYFVIGAGLLVAGAGGFLGLVDVARLFPTKR